MIVVYSAWLFEQYVLGKNNSGATYYHIIIKFLERVPPIKQELADPEENLDSLYELSYSGSYNKDQVRFAVNVQINLHPKPEI